MGVARFNPSIEQVRERMSETSESMGTANVSLIRENAVAGINRLRGICDDEDSGLLLDLIELAITRRIG